MGKIGQALFGGSRAKQKSQSSSDNQAFGAINSSLGGTMGLASEGGNLMRAFLGGDTSGFDNYKRNTGYNFQLEQGQDGITGNAAASGLLRSGGTGKALVQYGNDLQQTYADKYMNSLMGMSDVGLKAGGVLANAGQRSQSTARSKSSEKSGGLGKMLGKVATAAVMASDPRLKTNVEKIGELADGLNVYRYDYINHPLTLDYAEGPHVGVMADEVAAIRPDALGPVVEGYQFVDYSRIEMEGF